MNSTLQCLFQARPLTEYFLAKRHTKDLNRDNPLGKGGKIAEVWAKLLSDVFSDNYRVVAPRAFKKVIGEFCPQFMGYQQQDSQELLAFLLDGLHEDLNRIIDKPYTNTVDDKGREDKVVADEAWEIHKKRNDSIVVDLLQGQYKSTVKCPDCDRVSVTFDPFMYLSVPLPSEKYKTLTINYCAWDSKIQPTTYGLKVLKNGSVKNLKQALAKEVNVPASELHVSDVWKHKQHKEFTSNDDITDIRDNDEVWAYHVPQAVIPTKTKDEDQKTQQQQEPEPGYNPPTKPVTCELVMQYDDPSSYSYNKTKAVGIPLFVSLPKTGLTTKEVYEIVASRVDSFIVPEANSEEEPPFTISFKHEHSWKNHEELPRNEEQFNCKQGVKFYIHWADIDNYNSKLFEDPVKDKSAPTESDDDGGGGYGWKQRQRKREKAVKLDSCLDAFTEQEVLNEENAWYCSVCKKHQCATKKIDLWRLPEILIIHLKRFSYSRHWRNKITSLVDFPLEALDVTPWIPKHCPLEQDCSYDLFGVSMHSGGMGGGHYTAYAKSCKNGQWHYLNDSSVSVENDPKSSVLSPSAYLLFYSKRGKQPSGKRMII